MNHPSVCSCRSRSVVILNWRDTGHPEGGGSELYVEQVADGLAARGIDVTLFTAAYPGAPARETRPSGVRVVRQGGHRSVYLRAAWAYRRGLLGHPDAVIEVQNGMPFLSRLWSPRAAHAVLVHHIHREQWRVVLGPTASRIGWWLESQVAPRVNRSLRYVAVSASTKRELVALGVPRQNIRIIHNGTQQPSLAPAPAKTSHPSLVVVGRLVPHKRVELALEAVARLRAEFPDLTLDVVGHGWWEQQLRERAAELGVSDQVRFTGHVSEKERDASFARSWVSLVPSLKEGWGLIVVEAAVFETPSVGFQSAGGVACSIVDGETGSVVHTDDIADFTKATRELLTDHELRTRLGENARRRAIGFTWDAAVDGFDELIEDLASSR